MQRTNRRTSLLIALGFLFGGAIFAASLCPLPTNDVGQCVDFDSAHRICQGGNNGIVGGGTPTAVPTATPTPPPPSVWETLGGSYANDSPCTGGTGDPIGTVFLLTGGSAATARQLAEDRLLEIGMTSSYNSIWTTRDDFKDNGGCVEGAISRATNQGWYFELPDCVPYCVDSRWHTRCIEHAQPSAYGYWASCTPHWDSAPPTPTPPCGLCIPPCDSHYVPHDYNGTDNYGGSGYDAARDWMWYQLVHQYGMTFVGPVQFQNREPRSQCNHTITSFADGKVNVIAVQ